MQVATITLKGAHGWYLGIQDDGLMTCDATTAAEWEHLRVEPIEGNRVALKSWQGFYCTATPEGIVRARQRNVFAWEEWIVEPGETTGALSLRNAHGFYLTATPDGRVVCAQPESHAWESFSSDPDTWWKPGARSTHPDPLVGRLRIADRAFVDDTGARLPMFAHGGDWLALYVRNRDRARRLMDLIATEGYHGVRTWLQLGCGNNQLCPGVDSLGRTPFWRGLEVGPEITSNYFEQVGSFVADLARRDLRLVASQGDPAQLGHSMSARKIQAARYAETFRAADGHGHTVAFFDAGNEALWNDADRFYSDPANAAAFIQAYKDAGGTALCTLTSPENETAERLNAYAIPPADLWDVHGWRDDHWWDKRRHAFSITYEGKPALPLGIQSEPCGNGDLVSASGNKQELDHEAIGNIAAMSLIARQAFVWFSGEGVKDTGRLADEQGFAACPRLRRWLPRDVMRFQTLHHSGDSKQGIRVFSIPETIANDRVRIDGVIAKDGRFAYIMDGPSGHHPIKVERGFIGTITHTGTGDTHPFTGSPGQMLDVEWVRGRLVVGRLA